MLKKLSKTIIVVLVSLGVMILLYAYIAYPAEYVNRVLRWGDADVYDYQKFPGREFKASDTPFQFNYALDEDAVRTLFESDPAIDDLDTFLADNRKQAFLVIQNDEIIYEHYFNGANRETIVTSFSSAKSFVSTLVGVAISEGHIQSVNDPITAYLPELLDRDQVFADITIRDLLMMSSGIKYKEFPFSTGMTPKLITILIYANWRWKIPLSLASPVRSFITTTSTLFYWA